MTDSEFNPMRLNGRTIIVTGAAQGVGQAVAQCVLSLGGNVVAIDMNEAGLTSLVSGPAGERVLAVTGDVSKEDFAQSAVGQSVSRFGAVHGLVNNAGIVRAAMIEKMTLAQWQQVVDV